MRTTVDIPDVLYRKLKARAARDGRSVKSVILQSVEVQLQTPKSTVPAELPLVRSRHPGTLNLNNESIYELVGFP